MSLFNRAMTIMFTVNNRRNITAVRTAMALERTLLVLQRIVSQMRQKYREHSQRLKRSRPTSMRLQFLFNTETSIAFSSYREMTAVHACPLQNVCGPYLPLPGCGSLVIPKYECTPPVQS